MMYIRLNRYLVVIDDIWTISAWESIQSVLQVNKCDSRIIVTTRIEAVAKTCSPASVNGHCIHHMKPLKLEDSKKLFLSRAFGSLDAYYPAELADVMDNILKKCGGLPLAIISIASTLAGYRSSGSKYKWELICRSIGSQMESNPTLEGMRQILTLSYNHLTHELKNCMMYLSIFPEDYAINKYRLLRRWIAEGLVHEKRGLTMMEVAESYLDELLSRNMIDANHLDHGMEKQSYRVQDMLLEVMVSKALEANFVSLHGGQYNGMSYDRIRRLSIHGDIWSVNSGTKGGRHFTEEANVQHVRSLSMFQIPGHKLLDQLGKFTLLRVLDLEGCKGITNKHVKYACLLHLLRFLSFRGTNISQVPRQVEKLENLQTLDVRQTCLDGLPETVTKLEKLEYMLFSKKNNYMSTMWRLPRGLIKMKALRKVTRAGLGNDAHVAREVGELEQLNLLDLSIGPETPDEQVLQELALSLSKRHSLRWLTIGDRSNSKVLNFLHHLPTLPRLLQTLRINGDMDGLPGWIGSLTYLVDFVTTSTTLVHDQLFDILCQLPNLKNLYVHWKCYGDRELVARTCHKFQVLSTVIFGGQLPKVFRFEEGSMTKLEVLKIYFRGCEVECINGIEHVTDLKKLMLVGTKENNSLNHALEQFKAESERRSNSNQFQVVVKYED